MPDYMAWRPPRMTVRPASASATSLVVGSRHTDPIDAWALHIDREPSGKLGSLGVKPRLWGRSTLADPKPVGAKLRRHLLSKRSLHDLRHGRPSTNWPRRLGRAKP